MPTGRGIVSKRKWLLIASVVLAVVVAVPVLFDFSSGGFVFRFGDRNPVEEYANSKGLPKDIVSLVRPLGVNGTMDGFTRSLIDEVSGLGNYTNSPVVHSAVASVVADGQLNRTDVARIQDIDADCITNKLEVGTHHTDPTNMFTSNTELDDFNAIFTYGVDPNNQTAVKMFFDKMPNVEARYWQRNDGGADITLKREELTLRDPLMVKLAEKSEIRWDGSRGRIFVDGLPLWSGNGETNQTAWAQQPSHFFTQGRKGNCVERTEAGISILKLMGYDKIKEVGIRPKGSTAEGHQIAEVYIKGKGVYVLDLGSWMGDLIPREERYAGNEEIDQPYDPNWFMK